MIIGIMSDSHDRLDMIHAAMAVFRDARVDQIIHAGDFVAPFAVRAMRNAPAPVFGVLGNNDGEHQGLQAAFNEIGATLARSVAWLDLAGRRVAVMHEDYWLKRDAELINAKADLAIYGHTHLLECSNKGDMLVLNPGEVCGYVTRRATVVIMRLPEMQYEVIDLRSGGFQ